jgi:hypothetical protein
MVVGQQAPMGQSLVAVAIPVVVVVVAEGAMVAIAVVVQDRTLVVAVAHMVVEVAGGGPISVDIMEVGEPTELYVLLFREH